MALHRFGFTAPKNNHTTRVKTVKLVVFDLGGTVILPYCYIPEMAFEKALKQVKIKLSPEIIRAPMGLKKLDHLKLLFKLPEVQKQWPKNHAGKLPTEKDIMDVYNIYDAIQNKLLDESATYTPHAETILKTLKDQKIATAATTGFHKNTTDKLIPKLKLNDKFKSIISADQVQDGTRASMMMKAMFEQNVLDPEEVIFVTDSKNDIKSLDTAVLNKKIPAGIYIVGVAAYGTHMNVSNEAEASVLNASMKSKPNAWQEKVKKAEDILKKEGANIVIAMLDRLPEVIISRNRELLNDTILENRIRSAL